MILSKMMKNHEGFSLIELALVITLAAVVLAAGTPILVTAADHFRVVMAAQNIATQMQYARMKAVSSNEPFSVNFGASANFYQVETGFGGPVMSGPYFYPFGVSMNTRIGTGPVSFLGGRVTFLPTGNVPATGIGSAGRVRIINRSGVMIDIVVDNGGIIRQTPAYRELPAPF